MAVWRFRGDQKELFIIINGGTETATYNTVVKNPVHAAAARGRRRAGLLICNRETAGGRAT